MPKSAFSDEQTTWLWAQYPNFKDARGNKTTAQFLPTMFTEFHQRWPVAQPSPAEISGAGSLEKAQSEAQKKTENVCYYSLFTAVHS